MDHIDGMRTFVAVIETGSFSAAARRLGISNKLVSKYIATLEESVGSTLLFRTTRAMSISPEGKVYLEGCRRVLNELDALNASLNASKGLRGKLRVSAPVTFGEVFVADAAMAFCEMHPEIEIDLVLSDTFEDIVENGFDVAIRIGVLRDSTLRARKLGSADLAVVASPAYLEKAGTPTHPDQLQNHTCILDSNSEAPRRWPFLIDGAPTAAVVDGKFVCNSASACLGVARKGGGLAMLPDLFAQQELAEGAVIRVLQEFTTPPIPLQAVYLASAFERPKLTAFVDHMKDAIALGKASCDASATSAQLQDWV